MIKNLQGLAGNMWLYLWVAHQARSTLVKMSVLRTCSF